MNLPVRRETDATQPDESFKGDRYILWKTLTKSSDSPSADAAVSTNALLVAGLPPKTKDPSGGTTGRVKPYGRLGWMGARAEYSLDGEGITAPTDIGRGTVAARS